MRFILILIFLLFLPIPIKLNILCKDFIINLKVYKRSIFNFDLRNISNYINIENELKKHHKKIYFLQIFLKNKEIQLKKLIISVNSNKFKPFINIKTSIDFGISDAAFCAILYGLLWNLPMIIKIPLSVIFNVKNISLSINPKFNTNYLLFNINSIFFISFANVIYIMFLLFISLKNKEEIINE